MSFTPHRCSVGLGKFIERSPSAQPEVVGSCTGRYDAALIDVAIDEKGCAETRRPTTNTEPRYVERGVVDYFVLNMPGAVLHTSTYTLTKAMLAYVLEILNLGWHVAANDPALAAGVNLVKGRVTHPALAAECAWGHVAG